jgi:putative protease
VKEITQWIEENDIKGPNGRQLEIECFVHGALCMAVSGKCYISLDNANSSANRGACLQYCRRPYKVTDLDGGTELMIDNQYIMSPKDLKTIHFLNKMLDAGVRVLKIEGRARGAEYVKTVVECYKEAVQLWEKNAAQLDEQPPNSTEVLENSWEEKIADWDTRLARVFNRGFWDGYYQGQKLGEWTHKYGSRATRKKVFAGKCTNFFKNISVAEFYLEATKEIRMGDELLITGETTGAYETVAEEIHNAKGEVVEVVEKGNYFAIKTDKIVRRGDRIFLLKVEED